MSADSSNAFAYGHVIEAACARVRARATSARYLRARDQWIADECADTGELVAANDAHHEALEQLAVAERRLNAAVEALADGMTDTMHTLLAAVPR